MSGYQYRVGPKGREDRALEGSSALKTDGLLSSSSLGFPPSADDREMTRPSSSLR